MRAGEKGSAALIALGIALGALLVGTQAARAWSDWRRVQAVAAPPTGGAGALCSVTLINGQVYYGDCADSAPGYITLRDVYYVQVVPAQPGGQPGNRLVSRRKADWHAPQQMSIPLEKVMLVEAVAPNSRLADLVRQDRQAPPAQ